MDKVVPARLRIGEGLKGFAGAAGHEVLNPDEDEIWGLNRRS
jgi:hypothetical protein